MWGNENKILASKPDVKRTLGGVGVDCRIILRWISWAQGGSVWIGLIYLRIETGGGLL
jgi:hypothetical protein